MRSPGRFTQRGIIVTNRHRTVNKIPGIPRRLTEGSGFRNSRATDYRTLNSYFAFIGTATCTTELSSPPRKRKPNSLAPVTW